MYIETGSIGINAENSSEYGVISTNQGEYKGINVSGQIVDSIISYSCENAGTFTVDLYLDLLRQTINYKVQEINPDACVPGNHIGSIVVENDGCNCNVLGLIEREDPCLQYKRGFDPSFSTAYNPLQEVINICELNNGAFLDAFNVDYNINEKGDGIIIDNRIYGNIVTADGNIDLSDGN